MRRALPGFLIGALGLTALEVLVSNQNATGAATGAFGFIAGAISRLADPTLAAIPDLRSPTTAAPSSPSVPPLQGGLGAPAKPGSTQSTSSRFPAISQPQTLNA